MVLTTPRQRWWAWIPAVIGCAGLAAVALSSLIPSESIAMTENPRLEEQQPAPYARTPASAQSVNTRVSFNDLPDGVEVFETSGDFFFVTVSSPKQSVLSWLIGAKEPVVDLLTEEGRNGRRTPTQNRQISLQQMRTATQEAQFVALTAAGYAPRIEPGAVVVQDILCRVVAEDGFECEENFPAADVLAPADTILEIDGVTVTNIEELAAELADNDPGDVVDLLIDRPGEGPINVEVELSSAPVDPDDPDAEVRTIVGFRPFDTNTVDLPFDVSIATEAGGPSAGLSFTLALIDELTEGELTGGRDIAVTGTIGLDGSVGPIGGLEQKVNAVLQHGVKVFLIPASQIELRDPDPDNPEDGICRWECLNDAGHGEVVLIPVGSLNDALAVLQVLGGDPLIPVNNTTTS
ncbi:MAG: PDZ domain-containing protein [Candidatus Aldehydirespiratoraceae bacterium]|jgi:PDZ domain-containing protein